MIKRRSLSRRKLRSWDWILLSIVLIIAVGPIILVIASAFKLDRDIFTFVPVILFKPVVKNFIQLAEEWPRFFGSLGNSAVITLVTSAAVLLVSLPAAYTYSRLPVKGVSFTSLLLVGVRMFPPIVLTIPLYPLFRNLGLTDTPLALLLMYTAIQVSLIVMLLKAFMDTIPKELDEQAWIDGCNRLRSFVYILIPAMLPALVAALVFVSTFAWNEFVFAFIFTGTRAKTAPIYINEMVQGIGEGAADWGSVFASATIQLVPVLLWIWFLQRKMVGGFTIGAVKG